MMTKAELAGTSRRLREGQNVHAACAPGNSKPASAALGRAREQRRAAGQRRLRQDTVAGLLRAIQAKDPGTGAHAARLVPYALALGRAVGLARPRLEDIEFTCLLHDVGKIGIPAALLAKPGPLTADEWVVMRSHAERGARVVAGCPAIRDLATYVGHHHERWDGAGYPTGLAGEAIPLVSRIVAIADAYDALTSTRPYRPRLAPDAARAVLLAGAGTQWDARLVRVFVAMPLNMQRIKRASQG